MKSNEEYWKQGQDGLEELVRSFEGIVETFSEPRRGLVKRMFDGPMGQQFMLAPASTRRSHHNAFPCGLLEHSVAVARQALVLARTLAPGRWPSEKVAFCGLFHDFGKAGSPAIPYYTEVKEDWRRQRGEFYEVSRSEFMPPSEKSLYLLQMHGITLDHEETCAIRLSDGQGAEGNSGYTFNEPLLALIIHWADHFTMKMEKERDAA